MALQLNTPNWTIGMLRGRSGERCHHGTDHVFSFPFHTCVKPSPGCPQKVANATAISQLETRVGRRTTPPAHWWMSEYIYPGGKLQRAPATKEIIIMWWCWYRTHRFARPGALHVRDDSVSIYQSPEIESASHYTSVNARVCSTLHYWSSLLAPIPIPALWVDFLCVSSRQRESYNSQYIRLGELVHESDPC